MSTAVERLRSLVLDCLSKHLGTAAVYFADKLVTLSEGAPEDVFLLAQAHWHNGAHARALALLRAEGLATASPRFLHLTCACLVELQQHEEALSLLGEAGSPFRVDTGSASAVARDDGVATTAACELLRGRVYLALENRSAAARCFKAALSADALCYDAFDLLLRGQLVSPQEEAELLASLQFRDGDAWLGQLYGVQAAVRHPGTSMATRVDSLCAAVAAEAGVDESAATALRGNADVVAASAEWSLEHGDAAGAYAATSPLLARDPLCAAALPTHLSAAAALGKRNELFMRGHQLVGSDPSSGVAWYAVGCYYACTGQHASARRFLAKCTAVAPSFAPGWLAYGHAFAAAEESDQALAAYRTAARLFPGSPAPVLYMGVEYARGANWALATQFLTSAREASPMDARPVHELACVALRCGEAVEAEALFVEALGMAPKPLLACWEPTLIGLGHALRKQRKWDAARAAYEQALALMPRNASTLSALAFTAQLAGDNATAIELYHHALGLTPDDRFSLDMLDQAVADEAGRSDTSWMMTS